MRGNLIVVAIFSLAYATGVHAQSDAETHANHESAYADEILSEIPAMTVEQLRDLRTGAGMGFARVAELNRYPGPRHALDMSEVLDLSEEQARILRETFETMQRDARRLGAEIIEAEQHLNQRFVRGHVDSDSTSRSLLEIGILNGELRDVHVQAHLATTAALTEGQIEAYERLRGYVSVDRRDARRSLE